VHTTVDQLPGASAAAVSALRALTVFGTADLLRANPARMLATVPGLDRVILRRWVGYAQLLDVEDLTPALASAALAARIESLDTFATRPLATLRAIAAAAGAQLDDDALIALVRGALAVSLGHALNGTVLDSAGVPAVGVTVAAAGRRVDTDDRGRFRLVALGPEPLTVSIFPAPGRVKRFDRVRSVPHSAREGRTFKLPARPARIRSLSQLRGEALPALGSAPLRARVQTAPPVAHDVLQVVERLAGGDWRLVSRYLDFADDVFVARVYRIPPSQLPADIAIGDEVSGGPGAWRRVTLCKGGRELRALLVATRGTSASGPVTEAAVRARIARLNPRR